MCIRDRCVSCKACRREFPTGVDMARMKIEVLAGRAAKHGLTLHDRLVGFLPHYAPYAARPASTSIFMRAMSTPVGHSRRQALQETHSLSVSAISSEASASGPSWPLSASRSVLARPRVTSRSSRVTRYDGHMAPPAKFRQAPLLLHISIAPWNPLPVPV